MSQDVKDSAKPRPLGRIGDIRPVRALGRLEHEFLGGDACGGRRQTRRAVDVDVGKNGTGRHHIGRLTDLSGGSQIYIPADVQRGEGCPIRVVEVQNTGTIKYSGSHHAIVAGRVGESRSPVARRNPREVSKIWSRCQDRRCNRILTRCG